MPSFEITAPEIKIDLNWFIELLKKLIDGLYINLWLNKDEE